MPPSSRSQDGISTSSAYALLEEAGEDGSTARPAAAIKTAAAKPAAAKPAPAARPAAPKPAAPAPAAAPRAPSASSAAAKVAIVPKTGGKRSDDYYRAFQLLYVDERTKDVVLRFHKTDIVRITPKGDVYLYNGGYYTATTLYSINDALYPMDIELNARGGANVRSWTITDNYGNSYPYEHNVRIPALTPEDKDRGKWVLEAYGAPDSAPSTSSNTGRAAVSAPAPAAAAAAAAPRANGAANGVAGGSSGTTAAPAAAGMGASAWPTISVAAGAPKSPAASMPGYAAAAAKAAGAQAQVRPAGWAAATGATPPGYSGANGTAAAAAAAAAGPTPAQPQAQNVVRQQAPAAAAAPTAAQRLQASRPAPPPGFAQAAAQPPAATAQRAAPAPAPAAPAAQRGGGNQLAVPMAQMHLEEEGTDDMYCVVCMEHLRDTVLVPCGHMVLCAGCCNDIIIKDNLCPVCRINISEHCQIRG